MEIFNLTKSNNPKKKYSITFINPNTGRNNTISFGAKNMSDYTIHKDKQRKYKYLQRHQAREDWNKSGIYTRGFWSKYLLWNKKTIIASIKDIEKNFKIKINNKIVNRIN